MPIPHSIARFNKVVTNRLTGRIAKYLPGFGIITHTGRKSHRQYHTPVNIFRRPYGYIVGLSYGPDADWVRNVLASGECLLETRGRTFRLTQPRLIHDTQQRSWPPPVRLLLSLSNVSYFLELTLDRG